MTLDYMGCGWCRTEARASMSDEDDERLAAQIERLFDQRTHKS